MANTEEERFDTDAEGKQIAFDFLKHFGFVLTATTEEMNHLDGSFNTKKGKRVGVEVKHMSEDRYTKYNDIPIADDKYIFSQGQGKEASGLVATYKFDYVKADDGGIFVFTTPFEECAKYPAILVDWPIANYKGAPTKPQWIHFIPRRRANKWLIANGKIEQLWER